MMIKTDSMKIEEIKHQLKGSELDEETINNLKVRLSLLEGSVEREKRLARRKEKLYKKNWKENILRKSKCDCGAEEGELHGVCDMWRCPTCGGQLGGCYCDNDGKEPVPFINFPIICDYCGELWPEFFMDDEWQDILPEIYWDKLLCLDCWKYIKNLLMEKS